MHVNTLRGLCLYARFIDPTECKLASLRGRRDYPEILRVPARFFLTMYSSEAREKHLSELLTYACTIQYHYYRKLSDGKNGLGVAQSKTWQDPELQLPTVALIRNNHRALVEMDGTEFNDDYDALHKACETGIPLSEPWGDPLPHRTLIQVARRSDRAWFELKTKVQKRYPAKVYVLTMPLGKHSFGLMSWLTHFSRAIVFGFRGEKLAAKEDYKASIRHGQRAILDYHKAIVETTMLMWSEGKLEIPNV